MNREIVLASSPLVRLVRFEHGHAAPHRDPPEETSSSFAINFVEKSSFLIVVSRRVERFETGTVFVTRPGLAYRCRHSEVYPSDVCLSVDFADPGLAGEALPPARGRAMWPTNRLAYNRLRLLAGQAQYLEPFTLESRAMELLAALNTAAGGSTARPLFRAGQLAWYARRVDAARELLETRYAESHSLAALAQEAGMSPFHFARVFGELVGAPPHRYLLSVRLAEAAQRLRAGMPVTDACFEVGFSNLSHFIRFFRRRFGVSPSRIR